MLAGEKLTTVTFNALAAGLADLHKVYDQEYNGEYKKDDGTDPQNDAWPVCIFPVITGEAETCNNDDEAWSPDRLVSERHVLIDESKPVKRRKTSEHGREDDESRYNGSIDPRFTTIGQDDAVEDSKDAECDENDPVQNRLECTRATHNKQLVWKAKMKMAFFHLDARQFGVKKNSLTFISLVWN